LEACLISKSRMKERIGKKVKLCSTGLAALAGTPSAQVN